MRTITDEEIARDRQSRLAFKICNTDAHLLEQATTQMRANNSIERKPLKRYGNWNWVYWSVVGYPDKYVFFFYFINLYKSCFEVFVSFFSSKSFIL